MIAILVIFVIIVALYIYRTYYSEGFESKREKAQAIHKWFKDNKSPTYTRYKTEVPNSNIVDYEAVRLLPELTVNAIEAVL